MNYLLLSAVAVVLLLAVPIADTRPCAADGLSPQEWMLANPGYPPGAGAFLSVYLSSLCGAAFWLTIYLDHRGRSVKTRNETKR